jgi:hypothetical protein
MSQARGIYLEFLVTLIFTILFACFSVAQNEQKDSMAQRTYTSVDFNFSYVYPRLLIPNTEEFLRGLKPPAGGWPQGHEVVIFSAFQTPILGKARDGIVIMAYGVAKYGADWDAKRCIHRLLGIQSKQGWTTVRQDIPAVFDGRNFFRSDYEKNNPRVIQSTLCTIWKGSALEFILSGGSEYEVEQLFRSLDTLHFHDH